MNEVNVYDNFLSSYHFNLIESYFMGGDVPWFWKDHVVYANERGDDYQFNTSIFIDGDKYITFPFVEPCIPKLGCSVLHRIKANCRPKTLFHRRTSYHVDYNDSTNLFTSIFYVNTNNGWTDIKGNGKIKSVANRMVVFPGFLKHRGVSCTDQRKRVVINFNYEK